MFLKIKNRTILILFSLALIFIGTVYSLYIWDYSVKTSSNNAFKLSKMAETKFLVDDINKLNVDSTDLNNPKYQSVKEDLFNIVKIDKNVRFAYIYIKKGEKLYFIADSEPVDSKDYSPPGQEYSEAGKQYYQPFVDKQELITEPSKDRWGTWISVLVPIKDIGSGDVVAVFAMDYPVAGWNSKAFYAVLPIAIITVFLLILLFAFFKVFNSNLRRAESEIKYKYLFDSMEDSVMTLSPPKWKFTDGNVSALKMFGLKSYKDLVGVDPINLSPQYQPDGELSSEKARKMIGVAIKKGNNSFEWTHKKITNEEFFAQVSLVKVQRGSDTFLQAVVRDITEQKKSAEFLKTALAKAERSNKLMVGRELEMVKLKKEIIELKNEK